MAVNIETAQQLQDVLDAIYNNREQYDTYQNLTLYYNDITRTATIFTVDGEEAQESTKNVIAVFNPENIVTNNNAFFVTLMKSATVNVSTEETSVYDFALGGYVDVNTLLKNICVALGVSLSGTFADANPALYSDMINIIRNEYGQSLENNAPYIMKKFVNVSTQEETYKSLVPLMCIVRIAIYLNNLGIFNTEVNLQTTMPSESDFPFFNMIVTSTNLAAFCDFNNLDYPTFADIGMEVRNKQEFINFIRMYYTTNIYDRDAPLISNGLNAFDRWLEQYEAEVDWSQFIYVYWTQTTSTETNTETFWARQIPMDKVLQQTSILNENGYNSSCFGNNGYYYNSMQRLFKEDNVASTTFTLTVSHNNTTQEDTITHNKNVNVYNKGYATVTISQYTVNNLKPKTFFKPYSITQGSDNTWYKINDNRWVQYVDVFPALEQNTEYKNLKLVNGNDILGYSFKKFLEKENIDVAFDDDDIIYIVSSGGISNIVIFKHANTIGITAAQTLTSYNKYRFTPIKQYYERKNNEWVYIPQDNILSVFPYSSTWGGSVSLTFTQPITIDIHKFTWRNYWELTDYTKDTLTEQNIFTFYTYFGGSTILHGNNLGEIVEVGGSSTIEGLTLIDGATYPKTVIDLNSFNTVYPNWFKTQSNNPQIVNGVLAPTVTSTQWGAVSISKTTPTTQEDSEGGDIDFTNPEDVQDIIDDVDNANEDNDIDTSATTEGDETNGGSDEGYTPEVPADSDLPQLVGSRVYVLNPGAASGLMASLSNPDMWQNIAGGDLTRYIVSLQQNQCWDGNGTQKAVVVGNLEAQYQSQGKTYSVNGYEISGVDLYTNFDFGYVDIPYHFHNYLDITNTKLTLYLPYVGYVDLDISEFIGRKLGLEAKVYLPTGDLIYYISSLDEESNQKQIKATFSSNCSQEVPVAANTSILNSFKNSINYGNWIGTVKDAIGL